MEGDTRKTFIIHGNITADNESIEVKNIPSGFGGIGLTFDYANARMTGTMVIDQDFSGMQVRGLAELLVDRDGWYFLCGGDLTTPGLGNLQAGLLIGDYVIMTDHVAATLMSFAYDQNVPPSFQNGISGFFFTGRKSIPQFTVPHEEFDLGIGVMAFINAHFLMSSVSCTSIAGEAAVELGAQGTLDTAGNFDLSGCGSITVYGSVEQCVPTPTLDGGIDCELCAGFSIQKSLKVTMSMGTSGSSAGIGLGTCSGNEAGLDSNW